MIAERRRPPLALLTLALLVVPVAGCSDDGGEGQTRPTSTSIPGAPVSVGDCLPALERTEPFPSSTERPALTLPPADTAATVPCDEPHIAEVLHVAEVEPGPDGAYPGDRELIDQALLTCTGEVFEQYVGVPEAEADLRVSPLTPSADSWEEGDRAIICLLKHPQGEVLTAPARHVAGEEG